MLQTVRPLAARWPPGVKAEDEGNRAVHDDARHIPRVGGRDPERRER